MAPSRTATGPHNLPAELTSFIGREREIAQVKGFVSRTRLLTLTGAGGAGKSRLALRVAHEALRSFRDGVWIVELASLADPALVLQRTAAALAIPEQPGRAATAVLVEALRPKALLLVLDNCEHVLEACAGLAIELLQACPSLRILATSRTPLSVPGEILWRVPSLSVPEPDGASSLEEIGRSEAVRLLVERARASVPAFALTGGNAAAIVQLCRRLDGMPLAIELAAARTHVLSVQQIAARLDDRFRLLTGGSAAALPRHQTLRATMDWSYSFLAEPRQTVLRRSSVFAGGWTLEAAEGVCSGDGIDPSGVLDSLSRLVDDSLVVAETQQGVARYRMLETVRQYGRERLEETEEAERVRRRHLAWYLSFAEQADQGLRGPNEALWLGCLERDHDNLLAALDYARTDAPGGPDEIRLIRALEWFWHIFGFWTEGRARLEAALARSAGTPSALLPKVIIGAARLAYRQGDRARARTLCEEGLALSRAVGDRSGEACCLLWLGILDMAEGDADRAAPRLEESLAIYRALGDRWWTVEALSFLGSLAVMRDDHGRARALHEESLAVARETGNRMNITTALRNLGHLALRRGAAAAAAAYYSESLRLCRETESAAGESHEGVENRRATSAVFLLPGVITECFDGLARVACVRGAYEPAARLFGATEASLENLGGELPLWSDIAEHDRYAGAARAALGEPRFEAAREEGRAMSLDQAVDYALAVTAGKPPEPIAGKAARETGAGPLTAREREVAGLVAQGLTNREIAAALVITERTAETHVQNILNKLGFDTRAQVAAWAVERGLRKPVERQ